MAGGALSTLTTYAMGGAEGIQKVGISGISGGLGSMLAGGSFGDGFARGALREIYNGAAGNLAEAFGGWNSPFGEQIGREIGGFANAINNYYNQAKGAIASVFEATSRASDVASKLYDKSGKLDYIAYGTLYGGPLAIAAFPEFSPPIITGMGISIKYLELKGTMP